MAKRIGFSMLGLIVLGITIGRYTAFREDNSEPGSTTLRSLRAQTASQNPKQAASDQDQPAKSTATVQSSHDPGVGGELRGRLTTPLIELARANPTATLPVESILLPLSASESVTVRINRFEAVGDSEGILEGIVEGKPGSTVILSYVGNAEAGVVHLPGQGLAYNIRTTEDGVRRVQTLDLSQAPECALCRPATTSL